MSNVVGMQFPQMLQTEIKPSPIACNLAICPCVRARRLDGAAELPGAWLDQAAGGQIFF